MRIKHTLAWLAALVAVWNFGSSVMAQKYTPFGPIDYVEDGQAFETFDYHQYNDPSPAREGWFFGMERAAYFIDRPKRAAIGDPTITPLVVSGLGTRVETNSHDTGCLTTDDAWGNRYEFGFWEKQQGWMLGVWDGGNQDQLLNLRDVEVVFADPPGNTGFARGTGLLQGFIDRNLDGIDDDINGVDNLGRFGPNGVIQPFAQWDFGDALRFPVIFSRAQVRQLSYIDGVELMKMHQIYRLNNGSMLEFMYGARYFRFRDRFRVRGQGGVLNASEWMNLVDNDIVGPQIALRLYHRVSRWTLSAEGRFMAGFNFQSYKLNGLLASNIVPLSDFVGAGRGANLPAFLEPSGFSDAFHSNQWAPTGELRLNGSYALTTDIAFKFGYTGWYTSGVGRASNSIQYTLPRMQIREDMENQSLWVNMVTFGIEWNR